jgi:hypothetical protein
MENKRLETFDTEVDELNLNNMDIDQLVKEFCVKHKLHSFDGHEGVYNLHKLVQALGYTNIVSFLKESDGACNALIDYICKTEAIEWKDSLITELEKL